MRQLPLLLLLATAATAGCASGSASGTTPLPTRNAPTRVIGASETSSDIMINPEVMVARVALPVPAARSFATLPSVLGDLGVPVTHTDADRLEVGNRRLTVSGRLAGQTMSHWFDCGRSGVGEPLADAYRMRINLVSTVVPAGAGSEVQTVATATAQNPGGSSREPVVCNSTGRLEAQLGVLLRQRVAQP